MIDGHNPLAIQQALEVHAAHAQDAAAKPMAIVARTIKGWGVTSVLGHVHGRSATEEEKVKALAALDALAQHLGAVWTEGDLRIPPVPAAPAPAPRSGSPVPSFRTAMQRFGHAQTLAQGKMATRRAYGVALRALGHANPQVVALDADVRTSTYAETSARMTPCSSAFLSVGLPNNTCCRAPEGLAAGGKVPFVSTFGKFFTRAYDQVEMAFLSRLPLKLVGSHVGVSLAADGPSQMALPDVAFFRAWTTLRSADGTPLLYLLQPADAYAAYALTVAMAEHPGPCYLRTLRPDMPFLTTTPRLFRLGGTMS